MRFGDAEAPLADKLLVAKDLDVGVPGMVVGASGILSVQIGFHVGVAPVFGERWEELREIGEQVQESADGGLRTVPESLDDGYDVGVFPGQGGSLGREVRAVVALPIFEVSIG